MKDLLEGGSQTTITVMLWAFICLIRYPEYQDKIKDEIERVVGKEVVYTNMSIQLIIQSEAC